MRLEQSHTSPKLSAVVSQYLLCALYGGFIICAVNVDCAQESAEWIQDMDTIVGHWHSLD